MQQRTYSDQIYNPHLFAIVLCMNSFLLLLSPFSFYVIFFLFFVHAYIDNSHGITSHCIVVKVKGAPIAHNCIKSLLHFLNNIRFHAILTWKRKTNAKVCQVPSTCIRSYVYSSFRFSIFSADCVAPTCQLIDESVSIRIKKDNTTGNAMQFNGLKSKNGVCKTRWKVFLFSIFANVMPQCTKCILLLPLLLANKNGTKIKQEEQHSSSMEIAFILNGSRTLYTFRLQFWDSCNPRCKTHKHSQNHGDNNKFSSVGDTLNRRYVVKWTELHFTENPLKRTQNWREYEVEDNENNQTNCNRSASCLFVIMLFDYFDFETVHV